ncbi:MAG: hypothetical protein E7254_00130 [Lachnospiraceae bacterium]|nr:hypothetical protein [Lachnospiraceae bacterium]
MDKFKRIVCIIGVVLLVSLYVITLISAFFTDSDSHGLFMASVYSTVVVPAFIYAILLIAKVLSPKNDDDEN